MTPDDSLHQWLYALRREPLTTRELMAEIDQLRKGGVPLADLPADGISLQQALGRLEIAGKAERHGEGWVWAEPQNEPKERRLFA